MSSNNLGKTEPTIPKGTADQWTDDVPWPALVVENVRIDGKSTQRHIAYLGGLTESAIRSVHQRSATQDASTAFAVAADNDLETLLRGKVFG